MNENKFICKIKQLTWAEWTSDENKLVFGICDTILTDYFRVSGYGFAKRTEAILKSNSNKNITFCDPDIKSKQQIKRYLMKRSIAGEKETTIYIERDMHFQDFRIVLHQNPQHQSRSLRCHARWLSLWMVFVLSNWKSLWRHECNFILCCQDGSISLPCVPQYKGLPQDNQWEMLQRYVVRMQRIDGRHNMSRGEFYKCASYEISFFFLGFWEIWWN